MNPKEKAEELVNQFLEKIPFADTNVYEDWKKEMIDKAKKCALIAVEELINNPYTFKFLSQKDYWNEVKQEINNL